MSILGLFRAWLVVFGCMLSWGVVPVDAQINFNITFDDVVNSTGVGFDDPALGATRRNTIIAVTNYLNTVLDENGTADITIENSQTDGGGFLAASGPFFSVGVGGGFTSGALFEHATTGVDPFTGPDAVATFDFGFNYNSDLGAPASNEFDLFTVTLHEFSHALGLLSLVTPAGESEFGDGTFTVYDSFLERGDGTPLFDATGFIGTPSDLVSGDVFFNGLAAVAANGGNPVPIFSPDPFVLGSSISHIVDPNAVTQFAVSTGVARRRFIASELGILSDIGFNVVAVPEPAAVSALLVCLSATLVRRRRV